MGALFLHSWRWAMLIPKGRERRQRWQTLPQQGSRARCAAGWDCSPGKAIRAFPRQTLLQPGKPSLVLFEKGGVDCLGAEIHTWLFILFSQTITARLLSNSMDDTPLPFQEKRYHVYPFPVLWSLICPHTQITVKATGSQVASASSFKCFKMISIRLNQQKHIYHSMCSSILSVLLPCGLNC